MDVPDGAVAGFDWKSRYSLAPIVWSIFEITSVEPVCAITAYLELIDPAVVTRVGIGVGVGDEVGVSIGPGGTGVAVG